MSDDNRMVLDQITPAWKDPSKLQRVGFLYAITEEEFHQFIAERVGVSRDAIRTHEERDRARHNADQLGKDLEHKMNLN
jgi:hypothetical protein